MVHQMARQALPAAAREGLAERLRRLAILSSKQLRAEWQRLHRMPPPQSLSRDLLLRGLAYRIQEQALGGFRQATQRRLDTIARAIENTRDTGIALGSSPKPGARLLREWRGETHCVLVLDEGFSYRDQRYRSLTQVAKLITGAHWSGPRFFGIGQTGLTRREARDG